MELKLAVLADYATTTDQGKLVLGGVFDTLMMQRFPGVHPQMAVAIRLAAGPDEGNNHHVTVRLLDPRGNDVIPAMEGDLEVPGRRHPVRPGRAARAAHQSGGVQDRRLIPLRSPQTVSRSAPSAWRSTRRHRPPATRH